MNQSPYYPALTGVRALAAYGVFLRHFNPFPFGSGPWHLANQGNVGVAVFFVLSGFLIGSRYRHRVQVGRAWLATYFRNRIARIYPLYFLLTLLTFGTFAVYPAWDLTGQWAASGASEKMLVVGLNITLLRAFFEEFIFTGIGPGWTLTVEECFYALAPLLLLALAKTRRPLGLLAGLSAAFVGLGFALQHAVPHRYGFLSTPGFVLGCTFFGQAVVFFIGLGLAWLVPGRHAPRPWPLCTTLSVLACGGCLLASIILDPPVSYFVGIPPLSFRALNLGLLLPFSVALLFWGLVHEGSWLRTLLASRPLQLLGKSSYAFYLVHMGVFHQFVSTYVVEYAPAVFALTIGMSLVLHQWMEKPLHAWVKKYRRVSAPVHV